MPSDYTNAVPPADEHGAQSELQELLEWTLTEEDIREIQASGITLGNVIRQLELDCVPK